jgi:hypothetical protein
VSRLQPMVFIVLIIERFFYFFGCEELKTALIVFPSLLI